jgi:hypothetical protein
MSARPTQTQSLAGPGAELAPKLGFAIQDAKPVQFAAVPTLCFAVSLQCVGGGAIRSATLNTQLRIAATRRSYNSDEKQRLVEVFGGQREFGRALASLLWTQTTLIVPPFTDSTVCELYIPCTYDFEVAASKYLDALADGLAPLEFLFSGTVFYSIDGGQLRVAHIPWDSEADFALPVSVYRQAMDYHFPDSAWLRLQRDTFDRLYDYRARNSMLSWESTVEALLDEAGRFDG